MLTIIMFIALCVVFAVGFFTGRVTAPRIETQPPVIPIDPKQQPTMRYNPATRRVERR